MKTILVLEVEHKDPLPVHFANLVAQRAYMIDNVENVEVISKSPKWDHVNADEKEG